MSNSQWQAYAERQYCAAPSTHMPEGIFTCQNDRGADSDLIVWGDSHAMHLAAGMSDAFPDRNVYVAYFSDCPPQSGFDGYKRQIQKGQTEPCVARNEAVLDFLADHRASTVILTSAKRGTPEEMAGPIRAVFERLERMPQHKALYLGDFIRPGVELLACGAVPDIVIADDLLAERCQGETEIAAEERAYNDALAQLIPNFVPVNDVQCPDGVCRFFANGQPMFRDTHHLTAPGAIVLINDLKEELSAYLQD